MLFTSENAAAMAKLSHAPTSLRNAPKPTPEPKPQPAENTAEIADRRARMVETKESQMDKLDEQISDCDDPKMLHFLTSSRERLFKEWCVLTGLAAPAPRKSTDKPARQRGTFAEPT